jgi:hypothetical protein
MTSSLEIDTDQWSERPRTHARKYEDRWRAIDPHSRKSPPPVPAPPPAVPSLELDAEPPPAPPAARPVPQPSLPLLDPDPEPHAVAPAVSQPTGGPAPAATAFPELPVPLVGTEAKKGAGEEEVLELPAECVEDSPPPQAVPVMQGMEGVKPPEALRVVQGVVVEQTEEPEEVVEEVAEGEEDLDYVDAPRQPIRRRPHPRKSNRQRVAPGSLDKVNLGLGCHYARLVVMVAGSTLLLVGMTAGSVVAGFGPLGLRAAQEAGSPSLFSLRLLILLAKVVGFLLQIVTPLLGYIGSSLCLWMPPQTGARGLILAAVILDGLAGFLGLVLFVATFFSAVAGAGVLFALPAFGLSCGSWVMFMLTLGRLCTSLGEEKMAEEAIEVLIRGLVLLLLTPCVLILLTAMAMSLLGALFSPPLALTFLYHYFVFLRRQMDLIGSIRQVIAIRW